MLYGLQHIGDTHPVLYTLSIMGFFYQLTLVSKLLLVINWDRPILQVI